VISVVLVTWNSARYLPRCLAGIALQTIAVELIVVDHASSDDSLEIIGDGVRVIRNATNRGFSAAVNQALAVERGEYVLLCNPDAYLTPTYVQRLIAALEAAGETYGAATGKLLRADGDEIEPRDVITSTLRRARSTSPAKRSRKSSASPAPARCIAARFFRRLRSTARYSTKTSSPIAKMPTSRGAEGSSVFARSTFPTRSRITFAR
jgi:glycosyltransferase involved in cell wall biosynthesis